MTEPEGPTVLIRPDGAYLVSQPLHEETIHEAVPCQYPRVLTLWAGTDRCVTLLMPGALEHHELITAVRLKLERDLETPISQWHDMEPGDLIQLVCHALGDLLAVPGG